MESSFLQFRSVQLLSRVRLFATPWTAVHQVSLSITNSRSLLKLMSVKLVMPSNAIQPSHPLSSPSLPAFNLSQHQGLFQWVDSSDQVAKVLELQHQSFQWIFRVDLQCYVSFRCAAKWISWVQFSRSVVSDSLRPHGLQYTRLPCPSPTPGAYGNSCPSSQWCHPTISFYVLPFSCFPSFAASGSFPIWVSSLHQVAKVLELQLQHQSFQWIFRTDFL